MVDKESEQKLMDAIGGVRDEMQLCFRGDGSRENPGVFVRLDRIEREQKKTRAARRRALRRKDESSTTARMALWTAVASFAGTVIWAIFHLIQTGPTIPKP